ncbi:unnamed protein product [marine sediment metagenome]|uniref:Uncharacterized protein n=1 Tax=marine sediment metagenome TaxID=412755 RepID=X1UY33_9ZZZZ
MQDIETTDPRISKLQDLNRDTEELLEDLDRLNRYYRFRKMIKNIAKQIDHEIISTIIKDN